MPVGHLKRSLKSVARRISRSPSCLLVGCEEREPKTISRPFEKCLAVKANPNDSTLEIRNFLTGDLVATMDVKLPSDLQAEYEKAEQVLLDFTRTLPGSMIDKNKVVKIISNTVHLQNQLVWSYANTDVELGGLRAEELINTHGRNHHRLKLIHDKQGHMVNITPNEDSPKTDSLVTFLHTHLSPLTMLACYTSHDWIATGVSRWAEAHESLDRLILASPRDLKDKANFALIPSLKQFLTELLAT